METRKCPNCGGVFEIYPSVAKECCSRECSNDIRARERMERLGRECKVCGAGFIPKHSKSPGLYCSYGCMGLGNRKTRIERNGYWYLLIPEHPRATGQGYVAEHTVFMEQSIGRFLMDDEVVHHKNHDRKDNRLSNLQLLKDSEHKSLHMREQIQQGKVNGYRQRTQTAERMTKDNPYKSMKRGNDGRFITKLQ